MSTPPRRSRRLASATTAAPSPDTQPPARLLDLPRELLVRALSLCDPADIARVAAVSLLFHASLAKEAIRLWAQEHGLELPAQPEGEGCAVRWLCFAALLRESNPPARAAAGDQASVFIDGEGRLSTCGTKYIGAGVLGHGAGVRRLYTPTRLPSTLGGERAVSVAAGMHHSFALTAIGAAWSWGTDSELVPTMFEAFTDQRVVAVSANTWHSLALTADGAAWSWGFGQGYGRDGLLGHGDTQDQWLPKKIEAFAEQRVVAVSAGDTHSLAITADGAVWSWGSGSRGQLGHGWGVEDEVSDEVSDDPVSALLQQIADREAAEARAAAMAALLPKKIEALAEQRVVAVSAGGGRGGHSLAITAVWSWGHGVHGRLGHGDEQSQSLPKKVEALAGQRVIAVSAGGGHSFAITANGAVWSWGDGGLGQLGHGDQQNQLLPKQVEAFAGQRVAAVTAGSGLSLALTADGAVWSWGVGGGGQVGVAGRLGHGEDLSNQLLPKKIEVWASRPPTPTSSDGSEEDE